jgi:alkanesulfonate monooxygenase SsuD/methylene tetrahydromethanopterin reductase-like flavin-dependent oxidoreductase (luciferase family)
MQMMELAAAISDGVVLNDIVGPDDKQAMEAVATGVERRGPLR